MDTTSRLSIRDACADDRAAIRDLTLAAYAEHAQVMAPSAWAGLRQAVLAGLDAEGALERIVAERDGALLGSVMLYSAATNGYGDAMAVASWPELRLLAVSAAARAGRGHGAGAGMHPLAGEWMQAYEYAHKVVQFHEGRSLLPIGRTSWYEAEALLRCGAGDLARAEVERVASIVGENRRYRLTAALTGGAGTVGWRCGTGDYVFRSGPCFGPGDGVAGRSVADFG